MVGWGAASIGSIDRIWELARGARDWPADPWEWQGRWLERAQEEFNNFAHGHENGATFTNQPADGRRLDWALASPLFEAQKHHLIFRNSPDASSPKMVEADFTPAFE